MVNYQNSKIYKIESTRGNLIYIGSTTKERLSQRMDTHRMNYRQWKRGKTNKTTSFDIFDAYEMENCSIVLLELCPCNSKDEMYAREAHYIKSLDCVNRCVPGRSKEDLDAYSKQYVKDHRDDLLEYKKQYYFANIESILEKKRQWREANKEIVNEKQRERRRLIKLQQIVHQ